MDISGLSGYTDYMVEANNKSAEDLKNKLNNAADADDEELLKVCKQFEAYLWEQVIKSMEKTVKMFSDDDDKEGYASNMVDVFKDTVIQEISSQVTSETQGNNSLAQMLYEQMKRNINPVKVEDL
ncbi:MAG: rod-binding protein [Lachnospiraceae bacterium]|nr:rod-binding protein [Lachnospiraceae bacterium]